MYYVRIIGYNILIRAQLFLAEPSTSFVFNKKNVESIKFAA